MEGLEASPSGGWWLVAVDGEGGRGVADVGGVVGQGQVVEGDAADRRALAWFGELVRPEAEAGLGVEGVTGLAGAGDRRVGEDGVGDRELRLAADVVGLEHDAAVGRVDDVQITHPDSLVDLR